MSDKGRQFFRILREHPNGIEGERLAAQLGFTGKNSLGGMSGGGLAKLGKKYGVEISRLYSSEVRFTNGVRERIYKPEADIDRVQ